jgi:hypothetical protein
MDYALLLLCSPLIVFFLRYVQKQQYFLKLYRDELQLLLLVEIMVILFLF